MYGEPTPLCNAKVMQLYETSVTKSIEIAMVFETKSKDFEFDVFLFIRKRKNIASYAFYIRVYSLAKQVNRTNDNGFSYPLKVK